MYFVVYLSLCVNARMYVYLCMHVYICMYENDYMCIFTSIVLPCVLILFVFVLVVCIYYVYIYV